MSNGEGKRDGRRLTVLVVDDEPLLLAALARQLHRQLGWRVLTAANPGTAQVLYPDADIVLTDWDMPNGGGARVMAECGKPVVIHSADPPLGCPNRVHKPATFEEIVRALLGALQASERTGSG